MGPSVGNVRFAVQLPEGALNFIASGGTRAGLLFFVCGRRQTMSVCGMQWIETLDAIQCWLEAVNPSGPRDPWNAHGN